VKRSVQMDDRRQGSSDEILDFAGLQTIRIMLIKLSFLSLHFGVFSNKLAANRAASSNVVILCQVDQEDDRAALISLNVMCARCQSVIICVTCSQEAATYVEVLKCCVDHRKLTQPSQEHIVGLVSLLPSIRGLTKFDIKTLSGSFASFAQFCGTDDGVLSSCPGIGAVKLHLINKAIKAPFCRN